MKKAYIVTEGQRDADILKKFLPPDLVQATEFVIGSGTYSAQSLAKSILAVKQSPVALVLGAKTGDEAMIQEKGDFYREALRQASSGAKFEVFLAEPEVDTFFFQHPGFMKWLVKQHYSEAELNAARLHPQEFLYKSKNHQGASLSERMLEGIDDKTIKAIRKTSLMDGLIKFLSSVIDRRNKRPARHPRARNQHS